MSSPLSAVARTALAQPLAPAGTRVALVVGTRPDLVTLAPVARALGDRAVVVHSGEHTDATLVDRVAADVGMPVPEVVLRVGGAPGAPAPRGRVIGEATAGLHHALAPLGCAGVVVGGDTATALAGALAANSLGLPLVHVEAGLRSFDRHAPEEHHRGLVDRLADACCAPTALAAHNLVAERIPAERVVVTGSTVVDAVLAGLPDPGSVAQVLAERDLTPDGYVLATIHRPETVGDPRVLAAVLQALAELPLPVVLALHPRTRAAVGAAGLGDLLAPLRVVHPLGHRNFLALLSGCAVAVSDSGLVQTEVSVLKRPLVVVRRSTERPEVQGAFTALVEPGRTAIQAVGTVLADLHARLRLLHALPSPYGAGDAAPRVVAVVDRLLAGRPLSDSTDWARTGRQSAPLLAPRARRRRAS
jgi:UDP-N-acetylglucosamine 2-epimerase (non-hydrolysing)